MKLNLAIAGKVLASVNVDPAKSSNEYYLKAFRRMLVIRCNRVLKAATATPQFSLEDNVAAR